MTLPLYQGATAPRRDADGHAGLWFDKFCDQWRIEKSTWTLKGDDRNNPKLAWIDTLTSASGTVGAKLQIQQASMRLAALVESRGGRWEVLTTTSRFVTGLGRSHPIENGFSWHPTLGVPYLPGSSIKGLVRAWAERDADPKPDGQRVGWLLGSPRKAGSMCFLDAVPIEPVRLEADVMTPHYAGWDSNNPPGDWRSPTPIPFLVTAAKTPFLFGLVPRCSVSSADLSIVRDWLRSALVWAGGGAKTAVGYGRFETTNGRTEELRKRLCDHDRARDERRRAERAAVERATRLAALSPVEREIEDLLDNRTDKRMPEVTAIVKAVESGRWTGDARVEVARWLRSRMEHDGTWREKSGKKNPAKDKDFQRTIEIKRWLGGE